jgi:hypothetical protein
MTWHFLEWQSTGRTDFGDPFAPPLLCKPTLSRAKALQQFEQHLHVMGRKVLKIDGDSVDSEKAGCFQPGMSIDEIA